MPETTESEVPDALSESGLSPHVRAAAVVGLAFAFGWLYMLALAGHTNRRLTDVRGDLISMAVKCAVVVFLCAVAFAVQGFRPADLGIRFMGWLDGLAALGGTIVAFIASGLVARLVSLPSGMFSLKAIAAVPFSVRLGLVLTAAVCEEFIYRGFAIEELTVLCHRRWLAAAISLTFFTLGHSSLYGFSLALLVPGSIGAVLTLLYLWRRNLFSCILLHALVDGLLLLLLPTLLSSPGN